MKKITIVVTILIIVNFIFSSFFSAIYATNETTSTVSSKSDQHMTMDQYKSLDEGKADINGSEVKISVGDSDTGSATSIFGTILASFASIFTKTISNVTNSAGYYRTDSDFSASKTGLFTINSLIFGEYMLFNSKAYQRSTDLNPSATPNNVLSTIDSIKEIGAGVAQFVIKFGIGISLPLVLFSIIRVFMARKAADLAAWKKVLTRWVMCLVLLIFFEYIFIAIDWASETCVDTLWNFRKNMETGGYQSFEYTVESDILDSIEKTGGVTSLAYSFEFLVIVIMQALFLIKYVIRSFAILVMFIIAPIVIVIHSVNLMIGKESNLLGEFLKMYIILDFMQPFHALMYIIFFFTLSEIAINIPILGILLIYALYRAGNIAKAMFGFEMGSSITQMIKS